jgi:hypothetical protein
MAATTNSEQAFPSKRQASRVARMLGCNSSHQDENGMWMPCATHDQLIGLTAASGKSVKRKRRGTGAKRPKKYEKLIERGVLGIDTLADGSLVSTPISAKAARRLAATPAPPKDRVYGSTRNSRNSASSKRSAGKISIDFTTEQSLKAKVKDHNEKLSPDQAWKRTSLATLKAVYRRGAGAFSVSHRPGMNRNQWAMGRVNAFLKMLRSGKPDNKRYVTDNDLLPRKHPWRKP